MSVEMNKRISMKPGFGKKLETPRFNKQSLSSTRGADSSVFSNTTSLNKTSLKESVSKTISTSTLNKSISTSYTNSSSSVFNSKSSNYVPGNHFLGVSDYYRDRNEVRTGITTGIGYDASVGGYRSGKHDLELYTGGLTQRSERRMMQRAGMVDLSKLGQIDNGSSGSGGKKMSWVAKLGLGLLGAGVAVGGGFAIADIIKNNKAKKAEKTKESDIAKLNKQQQKQDVKSAKVETNEVKGAQNTNTTPVSNNPTVQSLQSAKTSDECKQISAQLTEQQQTVNDTIQLNQNNLTKATEGKEKAQNSLDVATQGISTEKQNIQRQEGTITKLQSQLSQLDPKAENYTEMKAQLESQIQEAEKAKQTSETNLKNFEQQKESAQNSITQFNNEISSINSDLSSLNAEKAEIDKGIADANKKAEELSAKEQQDGKQA